MELSIAVTRLIDQFRHLDIASETLDQLSKSSPGDIERTGMGFFVDLLTTSKLVSCYSPKNPDNSIIGVLVCDREIGDAILHSRNGVIRYLEVTFHDDQGWESFAESQLT